MPCMQLAQLIAGTTLTCNIARSAATLLPWLCAPLQAPHTTAVALALHTGVKYPRYQGGLAAVCLTNPRPGDPLWLSQCAPTWDPVRALGPHLPAAPASAGTSAATVAAAAAAKVQASATRREGRGMAAVPHNGEACPPN